MISTVYSKACTIWKEVSNGKLELIKPAELDPKLINSIFHVGEYYYYILDFTQAKFLYMSPEIKAILGYPKEISVEEFLRKIHPEDMAYFLSFERTVKDFFRDLDISQLLHYKVSYDFRVRKANGQYSRLLHQVVCLNHCEKGYSLHALGVHTDITHIKDQGVPKLSFIGLNGAPSFYDYENLGKSKAFEQFDFTKREIEVIRLIAQGMNSQQMAVQLSISKHTVKEHRKNIIKKSGLNTNQLVYRAIREGWV